VALGEGGPHLAGDAGAPVEEGREFASVIGTDEDFPIDPTVGIVDQSGDRIALNTSEKGYSDNFLKILTGVCHLFVHDIGSHLIDQHGTGVSIGIFIGNDSIYSQIDFPVAVLVLIPDIGIKIVSSGQQYIVPAQLDITYKITGTEVIQQKVGGPWRRKTTFTEIINRRVVGNLIGIYSSPIGGIGQVLDDVRTGIHEVITVFSNPYPHSYYRFGIKLLHKGVRYGK